MYEEGKYNIEAVKKNSNDTIFKEIPITIHQSYLVKAMYQEIVCGSKTPKNILNDPLDMNGDSFMEKHLENLCDTVEDYVTEQWKWYYCSNDVRQGWQRSFHKESIKSKTDQKRTENEVASPSFSEISVTSPTGPILPVMSPVVKITTKEPPRLDSLLIAKQIDTYCSSIENYCGVY
jgi:hypothetical protein